MKALIAFLLLLQPPVLSFRHYYHTVTRQIVKTLNDIKEPICKSPKVILSSLVSIVSTTSYPNANTNINKYNVHIQSKLPQKHQTTRAEINIKSPLNKNTYPFRPKKPFTYNDNNNNVPDSNNGEYSSSTKTSTSFIREAVRNVGPSVVRIDCEREITSLMSVLSPESNMKEGDYIRVSGSGFVTTDDGYILTNAHVVEKAKKITVSFSNSRTLKANLIACDELTDLAVLKVDFPVNTGATAGANNNPMKLKKAPLGDSSLLQSGDWLIAVGCPAGLDFTVTLGKYYFYIHYLLPILNL